MTPMELSMNINYMMDGEENGFLTIHQHNMVFNDVRRFAEVFGMLSTNNGWPAYYFKPMATQGKFYIIEQINSEESRISMRTSLDNAIANDHKCGFICDCEDNRNAWWTITANLAVANYLWGSKD